MFSSVAGYFLGGGGAFSLQALLLLSLGVFLCAGGANTLNQLTEIKQDAIMARTCHRPLPSGRVSQAEALIWGILLIVAGSLVLNFGVGPPSALLAILAAAIYVLIYTPLKRVTSVCTLVGALAGGIPPMIGWLAAGGRLDVAASILFAILFFWQIPHFLSLSWIYRDQYALAGFKMLSLEDKDGHSTSLMILLYSLVLFPISLVAGLVLGRGLPLAISSIILASFLIYFSLRFRAERSIAFARNLFRVSLIYLPLLFILLVAGRLSYSSRERLLAVGGKSTYLTKWELAASQEDKPLPENNQGQENDQPDKV